MQAFLISSLWLTTSGWVRRQRKGPPAIFLEIRMAYNVGFLDLLMTIFLSDFVELDWLVRHTTETIDIIPL